MSTRILKILTTNLRCSAEEDRWSESGVFFPVLCPFFTDNLAAVLSESILEIVKVEFKIITFFEDSNKHKVL